MRAVAYHEARLHIVAQRESNERSAVEESGKSGHRLSRQHRVLVPEAREERGRA
jgi:hypothetical protein